MIVMSATTPPPHEQLMVTLNRRENSRVSCRLESSATGAAAEISLAAAWLLAEDLNKIEALEEQSDFYVLEIGSLRETPPAVSDWVELAHYLTENYDPASGQRSVFHAVL